jgi:shikimate kinase
MLTTVQQMHSTGIFDDRATSSLSGLAVEDNVKTLKQ